MNAEERTGKVLLFILAGFLVDVLGVTAIIGLTLDNLSAIAWIPLFFILHIFLQAVLAFIMVVVKKRDIALGAMIGTLVPLFLLMSYIIVLMVLLRG